MPKQDIKDKRIKIKDKGKGQSWIIRWWSGLIIKFSFNGCEAKYHEQILAHVSLSHGIWFHPGINCYLEERSDEGYHRNV